MKKKVYVLLFVLVMAFGILTACGNGTVEKKVTCSMCNGTGEVKYYYGDGDDDYNMGICTSCDGKGFSMVEVDKKDADKEICDSCKKSVDELITKADVSGEMRSWCSDCWTNYDELMTR